MRVDSAGERHYVRGTAVALGWLLGEVDDPGLMAPTRDGDSARLPSEDVAQYEQVLRALSEPGAGQVAPAAKPPEYGPDHQADQLARWHVDDHPDEDAAASSGRDGDAADAADVLDRDGWDSLDE